MTSTPGHMTTVPRAVMVRGAGFVIVWWALTEGSWYSPVPAIISVLAATAVSLRLVPPGSWSWTATGLLRFIPYFVRQSVRGGVDVARRAFDPRLPIAPAFVLYRFRLPLGPSRVFFANTMSLLPGTLSTELGTDSLRLHLLDQNRPIQRDAAELEDRVAGLFGIELSTLEG